MVFQLSLPIQHYIQSSKSFIVKRRFKVVHAHSQYLSCCFTEVHSQYGMCQYTPTYTQRVVHVPMCSVPMCSVTMCSVTLCQSIVMLCALSGAMFISLMLTVMEYSCSICPQLYKVRYWNINICWGGSMVQQCCSVSKHSHALSILESPYSVLCSQIVRGNYSEM